MGIKNRIVIQSGDKVKLKIEVFKPKYYILLEAARYTCIMYVRMNTSTGLKRENDAVIQKI